MDFDDFDIPEEPKLSLRDDVWPEAEDKPVGRLGVPYNRDAPMAFVKRVERGNPPEDPTHYYLKYEGYAISQDILDTLQLHGVELVFTWETDTDMVLEHTLDAYTNGKQVDNGVYGDDEQWCAPEHEAEYQWEALGEDLYTNETFWGN